MTADRELLLLETLQERREARSVFRKWCTSIGFNPAKHHDFVIRKLQEITDSKVARFVIISMPPGSAKSTYTSKAFVPWFLGRRPGAAILACSYSKDLAASFGRFARNLVEQHSPLLGYELKKDTKAADEWETTTNGRYFCAGVGAGIAGHRADLGLIDDYLGNQEDADSPTVRAKQVAWFWNDFFPRLKPNASIVIIANRRHEADLIGQLTDMEKADELPIHPREWEVIKMPFFAEENDVLGRQPGERIWPEWFTEKQAEIVNKLPGRIRAGQYQQSPRPDDGDYFRSQWLRGYTPSELPPLHTMRIYGAGDFACSEENGANKTAIGYGAWDGSTLWILPKLYWKREDTGKVVRAWLAMNREIPAMTWWAEKGHISKSIGPFMRDIMQEEANFLRIEEITPVKAKDVRARSFQGLCEFGRVRFPKFADWWPAAENQILTFPGGSEDDLVDMFAHLGAGINRMVRPMKVEKAETVPAFSTANGRFSITAKHYKAQITQNEFYRSLANLDR